MLEPLLTITSLNAIYKILEHPKKRIKIPFIFSLIFILTGFVLLILSEKLINQKDIYTVSGIISLSIGGFIFFGLISYFQALEITKEKEKFETIEKRAIEHPEESKTAWDLARIKLESYLNRNLTHVKWIFILILLIMIVGFGIIIFGIIKVYDSPSNLKPSIVVTCSGILIEFIAATFLLIYKSTMNQAQKYVNVLERINAVGMSVQILESINSSDKNLKEKTKSELVKDLLSLYRHTNKY